MLPDTSGLGAPRLVLGLSDPKGGAYSGGRGDAERAHALGPGGGGNLLNYNGLLPSHLKIITCVSDGFAPAHATVI